MPPHSSTQSYSSGEPLGSLSMDTVSALWFYTTEKRGKEREGGGKEERMEKKRKKEWEEGWTGKEGREKKGEKEEEERKGERRDKDYEIKKGAMKIWCSQAAWETKVLWKREDKLRNWTCVQTTPTNRWKLPRAVREHSDQGLDHQVKKWKLINPWLMRTNQVGKRRLSFIQ